MVAFVVPAAVFVVEEVAGFAALDVEVDVEVAGFAAFDVEVAGFAALDVEVDVEVAGFSCFASGDVFVRAGIGLPFASTTFQIGLLSSKSGNEVEPG